MELTGSGGLSGLVDPTLGIVFGCAWGMDTRSFVQEHPRAELLREDGDVQEWRCPGDLRLGPVPVELVFVFSLDALTAVRAHFVPHALSEGDLGTFLGGVFAWFDTEPSQPDPSLLVFEQDDTRVQLDLMDGVLLFEDMDA